MHRPELEGDPPHDGSSSRANIRRVLLEFRGAPVERRRVKEFTIGSKDGPLGSVTELGRILDEGFEDRLEVKRRAADDLEDLCRSGLLIQRLGEVAIARL